MALLLPSSSGPSSFSSSARALRLGALVVFIALLSACDAGPSAGKVAFPEDAQIVAALRTDFAEDPNNERARALVAQLGGEKGSLDYVIRRVVSRQGAFEAHYDVSLRMGRSGADSLSALYAQMIPAEEAAKLPQPVTLAEQEKWLRDQAQTQQKTAPQDAAALTATLDALGGCYRERKAGDSVTIMSGLAALLSPERSGWYAERLQSPRLQLSCLPT